jgi:hypothetical protein
MKCADTEYTPMKMITGGGGINKDGEWYETPAREIEVPDDYLQRLWALMSDPDAWIKLYPEKKH